MKVFSIIISMALVSSAVALESMKVTGLDLSVQTRKFEDKTVEVKLQCFYADESEYRCTDIGGHVRIDFQNIGPDEDREKMETRCSTLSKLFLELVPLPETVWRLG